ncbi:hypothetical protein E3N88_08953 [Mikania micrantha]|uniref:Protein kinase domain-containing protein n=1 Tax=Mikania micrantha TaxID=192012 RepID=A0A5N6PIN6_9ASTR|nr:hypothetical protein E3N88_08953 [Mikania micrantha]
MGLLNILPRLRDCLRRGRSAGDDADVSGDDADQPSGLFFDLQTLQAATNFFSESNKLGHGGFGPVYKGLLGNGEQVAIKKLSVTSRQGTREFTNEVKLLLQIQHRNLVMLFGCCVQGPEKMLVYEYLPNKSLDYILFDKRSGYMAPEYAMHGYLSVKADVFSFGILVLEIVSGRKVSQRELGAEKSDILTYAWNLFQSGKQLELVDETLITCNSSEALMCIQLALLCCQAVVADRPDMNTIHLMMLNDSFTLPMPGKPGLQGRGGRWTTSSTSPSTTKASSNFTVDTEPSTATSIQEFSRNSISCSSINEGR